MTRPGGHRASRLPRLAAGCLLSLLIAAPPIAAPFPAQAGEADSGSAFRLYFTLPFIATRERQPARLGFELRSETAYDGTFSPLRPDSPMYTVLDLAFSRNGLERFEVHGADMRGADATFTRGIGLRAEEMALCVEAGCSNAGREQAPAAQARLGGE